MAELELDPRSLYEQVSEAWLLDFAVRLALHGEDQHGQELLRAAVTGVAALLRLTRPIGASQEVLALVERWVAGQISDVELRGPVWSAQELSEGALALLVMARLTEVRNPVGVARALSKALRWFARDTDVAGTREAAQAVREALPYEVLERAMRAVLPQVLAWPQACELSEQ